MRRDQKFELIFEDERNRRLQEIERAQKLQAFFQAPHFGEDEFGDQYEFITIPAGTNFRPVIDIDIPEGNAAVITHIGNEWYPGMEYKLTMDNRSIRFQHEMGAPEEPQEVDKLVKDSISMSVRNDDEPDGQERIVGGTIKGYHIPVEYYDELSELYHNSL